MICDTRSRGLQISMVPEASHFYSAARLSRRTHLDEAREYRLSRAFKTARDGARQSGSRCPKRCGCVASIKAMRRIAIGVC